MEKTLQAPGSPKPAPAADLNVAEIRAQFPILDQLVHGKPLVYLDSAATTQKPARVIEAIRHYYERDNANIHRGVHLLSQRATDQYEAARATVARFIGAASVAEIIFTRGTTEAINLVAQSYGRPRLGPGDEMLITAMEHHSNIVPWQMLCEQTGARLRVAPINDLGEVVMEKFDEFLTEKTKIVSVTHVSNALGTVNPIRDMARLAHARGAVIFVDGAQSIQHLPVDVQALGADFFAFSGHKIYGPTGIGVLYGREELLNAMPPYQGGGDMIRSVSFERTDYNVLPYKFEAGTPNIEGVIGMGAAIEWLLGLGLDAVGHHEAALLEHGREALAAIPGVRMIGQAAHKASVLSFVVDDIHPHDIGTFLDLEGLAVRTGHHCAQPVMDRYQIAATTRASLAVYNTTADLDALVEGLRKVIAFFA